MNEKMFVVAGIPFLVRCDLPEEKMSDWLSEPQPYNLYIDYDIMTDVEIAVDCITNPERIIIRDSKGTSSFIIGLDGFEICVDVAEMLRHDYNWQFSLFGNKGIVQKYILHTMEKKYKRIVFHGCAIRNPKDGKIIIGLGQSGAGKSVFVATALRNGWEMIATEQVVIDDKMNIYRGNVFDNVSPLSVELLREWLPDARIMDTKRLIEPLGQKVLVDMRKYAIRERKCMIASNKLCIANLNFRGKATEPSIVADLDYFLRLLQICSSEKISSPTIVKNKLVNVPLSGDADFRQSMVDMFIDSQAERIILSGGFEGFDSYLKKLNI